MVAVAILCLGSVIIEQGFLRSAQVAGRLSNGVIADRWMDDKAWEAREALLYQTTAAPGTENGRFSVQGRDFDWQLETQGLPVGQDLYSMRLAVHWLEGQKPAERVRNEILTTVQRTGEPPA